MQKPLNMHHFALFLRQQRIFLLSKAGLLVGLTLLLLTGLVTPAKADSGFYRDYVTINGVKYYTLRGDDIYNTAFSSVSGGGLGSFDRNQPLTINEAEANTVSDTGYDVQTVQLLYRVYPETTSAEEIAALPYTSLILNSQFKGGDNMPNATNWLSNGITQPNLLDATSGPGRYVFEFFFQGVLVSNTADSRPNSQITDVNNGNPYRTTFTVNEGQLPTTWNGKSADWFDANNWSAGVPNQFTDVTIPYLTTSNPTTATLKYPNLNTGSLAQVRTLRIAGNGRGRKGATLTLSTGELQVYGNFQDPFAGFSQGQDAIFTLAGVTQTFDGAIFSNFHIQGGGTKTLTNRMDVTKEVRFLGQGGVIVTRTDNVVSYNVSMEEGSSIIESESSYVLGVLRTTKRTIAEGQTNTFNGIGVELKAEQGIPGGVLATRTTGFFYEGPGTSKSIGRAFIFSPENTAQLSFTITFHYRNGELNLTNSENDLLLFGAPTGTNTFVGFGKTTLDVNNNVLTRAYINSTLGGTFTLGDQVNPLPVTFTSFTAAAQGADAVLNWATATEKNNKGFEVQVSSDGKTFRALGFVASESANGSTPRSYQYRDTEAGKQGTRYYRLRQVDLDGKQQFVGPRSVTFGASTVASVQGYPNPFGAEINLDLQTVAAGPATVSVMDGLGRRVRSWQPTLAAGASRMQLPGLQALPHGLYVVEVRYNDGHTQRLKLVKE